MALVVDVHTHLDIPEALSMLPETPIDPIIALSENTKDAGYTKNLLANMVALRDIETKMRETSAMKVDIAIISLSPTSFFYHLQGDSALKVARFQNDRIAAIVERYPERLKGMATVPLQSGPAAVDELERAINDLKLAGVEVGTSVNGKLLGDPAFECFLEKAAELDVPVYTHPVTPSGLERMQNYYLVNIAGYPFETTLAIGSLIFGGTFDRLPNLKVIVSHAGGCLPYIIGRWDHAFVTRPECRNILKPPSEYLKLLYYDTIAHGSSQLRYLISLVGADHVLLGTDHPFDMGDRNPIKTIHEVEELSVAEKEQVLGKNAQKLFKL
jgi:aminocarboxymuconate-semialdehyde decarboxylase